MHAPKWRTGAGVLTLLVWLASCGPNNKTVEYPLIETANTNALDIAKVELTDSATILHTDAYYRPHNWIRISSESYLQAGGKRYMLTGAEGITPDSLFWMPESGEASFTLRFEPLPSGTPSFDFIESDCEDCFKLFGIDLTGKKTFDTPDEVPEDLRQADGDTAVPDPIFKTGTTTVNVHFLHYRPELGKEANLYVNTLFGTQQPYTATIDPETGRFSPAYDESETITIPADHVVFAIGQAIEWGSLLQDTKVEFHRGNYPVADPLTYQTAEEDIFVGGDVYHGPKFVIDAIEEGKCAAESLHRYVHKGADLKIGRNRRDFIMLDKENFSVNCYDHAARQTEAVDPAVDPHSFRDARRTLTPEQVQAETARCLGCGASWVDPNKCIGCGVCTTKCVFDAIHLKRDHPECSTMMKAEDKLKGIASMAGKRLGETLRGRKD